MVLFDYSNKEYTMIDPDEIRITTLTFSVHRLIEVAPPTVVYNKRSIKQRSQLIESMLLRIPIGDIWLHEQLSGQYEIVDGEWRLSTIQDFMDGKFALCGLNVLTDMNGKLCGELPWRCQSRLLHTPIQCHAIHSSTPQDAVMDVVNRVK